MLVVQYVQSTHPV